MPKRLETALCISAAALFIALFSHNLPRPHRKLSFTVMEVNHGIVEIDADGYSSSEEEFYGLEPPDVFEHDNDHYEHGHIAHKAATLAAAKLSASRKTVPPSWY